MLTVTIYVIVNPINNNPFYIGATKDFKRRCSQHISGWGCGCDKSNEIQKIITSGKIPEFLKLDECEVDQVCFWELFYMQLFRSWGFILNQTDRSAYPETSQHYYFRTGERVYIEDWGNYGTVIDQVDYYQVQVLMDVINRVMNPWVHTIKRTTNARNCND